MYINGEWLTEPEIEAKFKRLERENVELKRLLSRAAGDVKYLIHCSDNGRACDRCKYGNELICDADDCLSQAKWEHEDEAVRLIGGV